jgi:uncharacterized protein
MLIKLKVIPNASSNQIIEKTPTFMRVKIKAAPEKGKANKELIKFLAQELNVKKGNLKIKSGLKKHNKIVEVI